MLLSFGPKAGRRKVFFAFFWCLVGCEDVPGWLLLLFLVLPGGPSGDPEGPQDFKCEPHTCKNEALQASQINTNQYNGFENKSAVWFVLQRPCANVCDSLCSQLFFCDVLFSIVPETESTSPQTLPQGQHMFRTLRLLSSM